MLYLKVMSGWLETGALIAILAAGPIVALLFVPRGRAPAGAERPPRAGEPCWTEETPSDRRHRHGRAQCVNDELMEADARMRWETPPWIAGG